MKERDALRQAIQSNPKLAAKLLKRITPGPPPPDEPLSVLCVPWPGLVDDSVKKQCARCGQDVAIAPSTQEIVAAHPSEVHFLCMDCAIAPVN